MTVDPVARIARCHWCLARAPIIWALTGKRKPNGTPVRMPIDARPDPAGNVELTWSERHPDAPPLAKVHKGPPGMLDDWTAYMGHHVTCDRDAPTAVQR